MGGFGGLITHHSIAGNSERRKLKFIELENEHVAQWVIKPPLFHGRLQHLDVTLGSGMIDKAREVARRNGRPL